MKLKGLLALLLTLSMTLLTACGAQTQPTEEKRHIGCTDGARRGQRRFLPLLLQGKRPAQGL